MTHLLQSHDWEKYSKSQGYQTFWRDGDGYQLLALLYHTPLGNYLYCPYGPLLTGSDPEQSMANALDALHSLAREVNAFFVRIEPLIPFSADQMHHWGFVKSHDLDPAHTWVLDLTQPTDSLLAGIEKTKVRHHRNHQKKGLVIRTTTDPEQITILASLLQGVGQRDHFTPQDADHLKGQLAAGFATLYIAEYTPEGSTQPIPIAASLVYDYGGTRYYAHAATDDNYRKLMAGTVLLVQMILDAKDTGAHTFDFWGITTSSDPSHPWYGFTQYKKSFGGHQVDYSGTWDLPLRKLRYRLYQLLRKLNRSRRAKH